MCEKGRKVRWGRWGKCGWTRLWQVYDLYESYWAAGRCRSWRLVGCRRLGRSLCGDFNEGIGILYELSESLEPGFSAEDGVCIDVFVRLPEGGDGVVRVSGIHVIVMLQSIYGYGCSRRQNVEGRILIAIGRLPHH